MRAIGIGLGRGMGGGNPVSAFSPLTARGLLGLRRRKEVKRWSRWCPVPPEGSASGGEPARNIPCAPTTPDSSTVSMLKTERAGMSDGNGTILEKKKCISDSSILKDADLHVPNGVRVGDWAGWREGRGEGVSGKHQ